MNRRCVGAAVLMLTLSGLTARCEAQCVPIGLIPLMRFAERDQVNESIAPAGHERVEIAGRTFYLELAADDEARARGLMGRQVIHEDRGMLFIYPVESRRSFWMKDCLIDIDLIFLDSRGRVVNTAAMKREPLRSDFESQFEYQQRLQRYMSRRPMQFAIELKAGSIAQLGLKIGETVDLDTDRLLRLAE